MAEGTPINASQLFSDDASEFFIDAGVPRYNRRLTDKILAAFNHAYAMGEMDLARNLWECLVAAEKLGQQQHGRRRPNQALDLAAEWVAFVDARDRYREVSRAPQPTTSASPAGSASRPHERPRLQPQALHDRNQHRRGDRRALHPEGLLADLGLPLGRRPEAAFQCLGLQRRTVHGGQVRVHGQHRHLARIKVRQLREGCQSWRTGHAVRSKKTPRR